MEMLVISIMSKNDILIKDIEEINQVIKNVYKNSLIRINKYKYEDDLYFNLDIDIKNVEFIGSFEEEKLKLAKLLIELFNKIEFCENILAGYQDTASYVIDYQKDKNKALTSSGIVVSRDKLKRDDLLYSNDSILVYFNEQIERLGHYYD